MPSPFAPFEVLSFDCYGTLIDWEAGLWAALQPLLAPRDAVWARERVLEAYARHEHAIEAASPGLAYEAVLARVHGALATELGLASTPELDRAFGTSIPHWPAFADSMQALAALKTRYKLVILSNVSRAGIEASVGRLGVPFDAVYTAEAIGSYKPDPANFRYLLEHVQADFGVAPEGLLHVAQSLFHDHVPARALGLANAWIDRQGLAAGGGFGATTPVEAMPTIDHRFESLEAFAEAALR